MSPSPLNTAFIRLVEEDSLKHSTEAFHHALPKFKVTGHLAVQQLFAIMNLKASGPASIIFDHLPIVGSHYVSLHAVSVLFLGALRFSSVSHVGVLATCHPSNDQAPILKAHSCSFASCLSHHLLAKRAAMMKVYRNLFIVRACLALSLSRCMSSHIVSYYLVHV